MFFAFLGISPWLLEIRRDIEYNRMLRVDLDRRSTSGAGTRRSKQRIQHEERI